MAASTKVKRSSGAPRQHSKHVRVSEKSVETLELLTHLLKTSRPAIMDAALEQYRRTMILDGMHDAYAAMQQDAAEWSGLKAEFQELEGPIADGTD